MGKGKCAVQNCPSVWKSKTRLKFLRFPNDKKQRDIWMTLCGNVTSFSKTPAICSDHFEADILHTLQCRLLGLNDGEKRCNCSAPPTEIPTLNLPETVEVLKVLNEYARSKSEIMKAKERRQIVDELLLRSQFEDPGSQTQKTPTESIPAKKEETKWEQCNSNGNIASHSCLQDVEEAIMISIPQLPEESISIKVDEIEIDEMSFLDIDPPLEDLCRMCALPSTTMINVFGERGIKEQLQQKINLCLPIQVQETDYLPKAVCISCISLLEESYKLATNCLQADLTLKSKYDKMHPELNPEKPMDIGCMEELSSQSPAPEPREVNVKVEDEETPVAPKLTFDFVTKVATDKLPVLCRICQQLLCTVDDAKSHYLTLHNKSVCIFCFDIFSVVEDLLDHINDLHISNCEFCDFKVVGPGELDMKQHIEEMHSNQLETFKQEQDQKENPSKKTSAQSSKKLINRPTCKFCFAQFDTKAHMKKHFLQVHKKIICLYCMMEFKTKQLLHTHLKDLSHEIICSLCPFECSAPRGLKCHVSLIHGDGNNVKYACKICSSTLQSKSHLLKHYTSYHNCHFCLVCESRFPTVDELQSHQQEEKHWECHKCDGRFEVLDEFTEHLKSHYIYQCKICRKTFKAASNLQGHVEAVHHCKSFKNVCSICDRIFRTPRKLALHMIRHKNEKNVSCYLCDRSFFDNKALKIHMACHSEERKFVCEHCGTKFKHYRNLRCHVSAVHMSWEYMCALCNSSYSSEVDVVMHFNNHPDKDKLGYVGKPFLKVSSHHCEICDKYFATKMYLTIHMKNHQDDLNTDQFECDDCKQVFPTKQKMQNHYSLKHKGSKSLNCPFCNKSFLSNSRLTLHLKNHESGNEKIYKCVHCDKVFTRNQNLKMHLRTVHYKIRSYVCTTCHKSFFRSNHLKQHLAVHTGVKAFQCDLCPRQFTQVGDMRRHKVKHHSTTQSAVEEDESQSTYEIILIAPCE